MPDLGEHVDMSGWCPSCVAGNHEHHRLELAGICVGCSCPYRPEPEDDYRPEDDDTTVRETDERPSELLNAEELDTALLLLVVDAQGRSRMWIEPTADPGHLAKGLRRTAKSLERSRERTIETVRTMLDAT